MPRAAPRANLKFPLERHAGRRARREFAHGRPDVIEELDFGNGFEAASGHADARPTMLLQLGAC